VGGGPGSGAQGGAGRVRAARAVDDALVPAMAAQPTGAETMPMKTKKTRFTPELDAVLDDLETIVHEFQAVLEAGRGPHR
jgi:hypothetical protein